MTPASGCVPVSAVLLADLHYMTSSAPGSSAQDVASARKVSRGSRNHSAYSTILNKAAYGCKVNAGGKRGAGMPRAPAARVPPSQNEHACEACSTRSPVYRATGDQGSKAARSSRQAENCDRNIAMLEGGEFGGTCSGRACFRATSVPIVRVRSAADTTAAGTAESAARTIPVAVRAAVRCKGGWRTDSSLRAGQLTPAPLPYWTTHPVGGGGAGGAASGSNE